VLMMHEPHAGHAVPHEGPRRRAVDVSRPQASRRPRESRRSESFAARLVGQLEVVPPPIRRARFTAAGFSRWRSRCSSRRLSTSSAMRYRRPVAGGPGPLGPEPLDQPSHSVSQARRCLACARHEHTRRPH
jgi:hypothetical protein